MVEGPTLRSKSLWMGHIAYLIPTKSYTEPWWRWWESPLRDRIRRKLDKQSHLFCWLLFILMVLTFAYFDLCNADVNFFFYLSMDLLNTLSEMASQKCEIIFIFIVHDRLQEKIEHLQAERTCKVCLSAEVSRAFRPCGHLSCCAACAKQMKDCPICR